MTQEIIGISWINSNLLPVNEEMLLVEVVKKFKKRQIQELDRDIFKTFEDISRNCSIELFRNSNRQSLLTMEEVEVYIDVENDDNVVDGLV